VSEMVIQGVVNKGPAKNKAGFYNVEIDGEWYSLGKGEPKFGRGDTIRFTSTKNGQWNNGDPKTVEIVTVKQNTSASSGSYGGGKSSENWDARAKYWEDKEKKDVVNHKEQRYRFSLATAVDIVTAALKAGAITLSEAKKKDAAFDSFVTYVKGTAADLYNDIETFMAENAMEDDAKYAIPDEADDDIE
jgi:hypothetical protein